MFKEIIGKIKTKINERNQSIEEYHKLLSTSQVINGLLTLPTEMILKLIDNKYNSN